MKEYEFTAKTIDKAINEGLTLLNKKQEDVDIKIVSEGGLFKKAKIIITTDEVDEESVKSENVKVEVQSADEKIEDEPKIEVNTKKEKKPKVVLTEEELKPVITEKQPVEKENNVSSKAFVEGLLKQLNIESEVVLEEQEETTMVSVKSTTAGCLIGHRGEGLNSLQYLCNIIEEKKNPKSKHVILDIEGYKERRAESLKGLAKRCAEKVLKTHKSYKLEPMNAYERRIIHTELQGMEGIVTISIGEEPNRRIVINIAK